MSDSDLRTKIASILGESAPAAAPAAQGASLAEIRAAYSAGLQDARSAHAPPPAAPANRQPASDAGGPAPAGTRDRSEMKLWEMTAEDREHLIREKGLGWYANTLRQQAKGTRFHFGRGTGNRR